MVVWLSYTWKETNEEKDEGVRMRKKQMKEKDEEKWKKMKNEKKDESGMACNFEIWSWWHYCDLHTMACLIICLTNKSNLRNLSIYLGPLSHFNNYFLIFSSLVTY